MSKGPGAVEARIAELLAATRDRGLPVAELADHAFALKGRPASRAQRLSATRAGHRLIRRTKDTVKLRSRLVDEAHAEAEAAGAERPTPPKFPRTFAGYNAAFEAARKAWAAADARYEAALKATEPWRRAEKLWAYVRPVRLLDAVHRHG
jgi:hypothetical protein